VSIFFRFTMAKALIAPVSYEVGRIKSFSQKSGWGFIQLFENGIEDAEGCKDVFFHRADVAKTGATEVRPGLLVHCKVVSTGKGEKASDINIVDDVEPEPAPTSFPCVASCEPLIHTPYIVETSPRQNASSPPPTAAGVSRYSLRSTGNFTTWRCSSCHTVNSIPSIQRVMVICPCCSAGHQVQGWICACSQLNKRGARHCGYCDLPFARACQEVCVDPAAVAAETGRPSSSPVRRSQRLRSRWQHGLEGWAHPEVDAPAASLWCQDGSGATDFRRVADTDVLIEKCRTQLRWAHAMLTGATTPEHIRITPEWLLHLSQELAAPERRLLCPTRGMASLAPNSCADVEDPNVLGLFEVLGMLIAIAVAMKIPLYPGMPTWLARSLLGYPTTVEDLSEFDPAVWRRVEDLQARADVGALGLHMEEEVVCGDVTRVFRHQDGAPVTADNKDEYLAWLADVRLGKAVEPQLRNMRHGFLYALMGHHLLQTLTPETLALQLHGSAV